MCAARPSGMRGGAAGLCQQMRYLTEILEKFSGGDSGLWRCGCICGVVKASLNLFKNSSLVVIFIKMQKVG